MNLARAPTEKPGPTAKTITQIGSSPTRRPPSPLLTPANSDDHSALSPDSSNVGQGDLYPTSPSLISYEIEPSNDWDSLDCSFLLEIDWTSPPGIINEEDGMNSTLQLSPVRNVSECQSRPPRQAWFTALPAEVDTSTKGTDNALISPQATSRMMLELKKLYNNHWENTVLDILPPVFRELSSHAVNCGALENGILALSAAHLSHIHIQIRVKFGTDGDFYTGPNHGHLVHMRHFYDVALRQLSRFIAEVPGDNVLILGSFLVLMLVEKTVGSFRGEAFHESGIDKLLSEELPTLSKNSLGYGLIQAWLVFRAMNWSHRIPFTVLSYSKALREMGIDFVAYLSRDIVLPIMLESYYLNTMVLFERFVGRGDMEPISSRCYRFYHSLVKESNVTLPWRPAEHPPDDDYREKLLHLSSPLEDWHAGLLLADRPIESFGRRQESTRSKFLLASSDPRLFSLNPLYFRSHQAAMNYASYLCACMPQS